MPAEVAPPIGKGFYMLSVESDIAKAIAKLKSITEAQQPRFSVAKALTDTAKDVQAEVRKNMPQRFTLRRQWVVQGIRFEKATKETLTATIYSRDKFMGLQELGGPKSPLRQYLAIPTRAVRRTPKDIIKAADKPKNLGDKAHVVEVEGHKYLALKKPRKGRSGNELRLLYLLVPRAQIKERLGLNKDAQRIVRANFAGNLQRALEYAMRTAR